MDNNISYTNRVGPVNVWIIEDHPDTRTMMVETIREAMNYTCTLAVESCEEAFRVMHTSKSPDIILLDIHLLGISGLEGLHEFKLKLPQSHVIFMTVEHELETIIRAISNGASGYYWKGANHYDIIEIMDDVMNGGLPIDPFSAKKIISRNNNIKHPNMDYHLSDREIEVLKLFAEGKSMKMVAGELGVTFNTINDHRKHIYKKMGVHNLAEASTKAHSRGLL